MWPFKKKTVDPWVTFLRERSMSHLQEINGVRVFVTCSDVSIAIPNTDARRINICEVSGDRSRLIIHDPVLWAELAPKLIERDQEAREKYEDRRAKEAAEYQRFREDLLTKLGGGSQ